jgi:hypothetical protein
MKEKFIRIADIVIDKLEGGYFSHEMFKDGRLPNTQRLRNIYKYSGETMMGIDRKAGGNLNKTTAGQKFWALIDNSNKKSWPWNYKGGKLEKRLRKLAAEVLYPHFKKLHDLYLSPKSQQIIAKDDRLFFHFVYATWNGAGRFKGFAEKFNEVVKRTNNKDKLVKIALQHRLDRNNSLYTLGVKKMRQIFSEMKSNKGVFAIIATVGLLGAGIGVALNKVKDDKTV